MRAELYHPIYLVIVTIATFLVVKSYPADPSLYYTRRNSRSGLGLLLSIFLFFFIGQRPINDAFFADMSAYKYLYNVQEGLPYVFDSSVDNLFFDNWFSWMASQSIGISLIFIIFAAVYFGCIYFATKRIFPDDSLLALLVYLAAFSTFSYGTNGLKAGMATATFLLAIAYRDKLWISIPIALFTYTQHHSMILVIVAYFLTLIVKDSKYYFIGWVFCLLMAALHVTAFQTLFAGFTDEQGAQYLLSKRNSGFRIDFILYSIVPIWIGYLMVYKYKIESGMYKFLLNLYLCTNGVWLLCMYANFTNRISYLSWFIYPIVLLYPFLNIEWSDNQPRYLRYVVYGHLAFTLFMTFVYYA